MKRILLVDDELDIRKVVQARLQSAGYEVIIAVDGSRALELAKSERPDLIVLDLRLPKLDGFEVCRQLKYDPLYQSIPILMLTARSTDRDIQYGMLLGADGYITKPFDGEQLLARVTELLDKADRHATARSGEGQTHSA